jgi:hypothetical protein
VPLVPSASAAERTSFVFLDETGRLPVAMDRFFGVGLLKCPEPAVIQRPMQAMRDRRDFRVELKWSEVRQNVLPAYQEALGCFFACQEAQFACFIADKQANDPIARFGDQWHAYERLAAQLVIGNIARDETVTVLADEYSTPANQTFEENFRALIEQRLARRAVTGVCRMRSTGVDTFQILDLLLGAVAYDYKRGAGLLTGSPRNPKGRLLTFIKNELGVQTFVGGLRTSRINVAEYRV